MLNVVINARAQQVRSRPTPDDFKEMLQTVMNESAEVERWNVPLSSFTVKSMEFGRRGSLGPILLAWGLKINHPAIRPSAIEELLVKRFGYWTDDVDHEEFFV
jgi:hypothetical protein